MLRYFFWRIYILPLSRVILSAALAVLLWAVLRWRLSEKRGLLWQAFNGALLLLCVVGILYKTLLRGTGSRELWLRPFTELALARESPEFYRQMLMNTVLFLPFGLTLMQLLPRRLSGRDRFLLAVGIGCLCSVFIEMTQFFFSLGTAETDDVLCNTLGVCLAGLHLPISAALCRLPPSPRQKA